MIDANLALQVQEPGGNSYDTALFGSNHPGGLSIDSNTEDQDLLRFFDWMSPEVLIVNFCIFGGHSLLYHCYRAKHRMGFRIRVIQRL